MSIRIDLEIYAHRYIVFGVLFKKSANTFGVIAIAPSFKGSVILFYEIRNDKNLSLRNAKSEILLFVLNSTGSV
jgi:hypothetical protein